MDLRLTGRKEALSLELEKVSTEVQQKQTITPSISKRRLCSDSRNTREEN
jgi:hypothetical protein